MKVVSEQMPRVFEGQTTFTLDSYDLIVASFVIHTTDRLEVAMRNLYRLLKPCGYVTFAESTNNDQTRAGFIFSTVPRW